MKYAKMLGLLTVVAAALMVFVAAASATVVTEGPGDPIDVGDTIHAESEGATKLDGSINITCQKSTVHGHVTDAGGKHEGPDAETTTVKAAVTTLTFSECGKDTVTVLTGGTLEIHSLGNGTGTLTATGAEVTVLTHFSIFNITVHCIYKTSGTDVGTLTGSGTTGGTATLDIESAGIPQVETDGLCGSDSEWTASYRLNEPDSLTID